MEVRCSTGCPLIDRRLGGGFPRNSISEVCGEDGAGKTQLCLQIALQAQLPLNCGGMGGSTIYVHTESLFPFRRLGQIADAIAIRHGRIGDDPGDAVFPRRVCDTDELWEELSRACGFIESRRSTTPVTVLIIDSVASLFRGQYEFTHAAMTSRKVAIRKIYRKVKAMARAYNLAVIVTNQVSGYFPGNAIPNVPSRRVHLTQLWTSGCRVVPALGVAWDECVENRFFLSRQETVGADEATGLWERKLTRRLQIVFATWLGPGCVKFEISCEGVHGV